MCKKTILVIGAYVICFLLSANPIKHSGAILDSIYTTNGVRYTQPSFHTSLHIYPHHHHFYFHILFYFLPSSYLFLCRRHHHLRCHLCCCNLTLYPNVLCLDTRMKSNLLKWCEIWRHCIASSDAISLWTFDLISTFKLIAWFTIHGLLRSILLFISFLSYCFCKISILSTVFKESISRFLGYNSFMAYL